MHNYEKGNWDEYFKYKVDRAEYTPNENYPVAAKDFGSIFDGATYDLKKIFSDDYNNNYFNNSESMDLDKHTISLGKVTVFLSNKDNLKEEDYNNDNSEPRIEYNLKLCVNKPYFRPAWQLYEDYEEMQLHNLDYEDMLFTGLDTDLVIEPVVCMDNCLSKEEVKEIEANKTIISKYNINDMIWHLKDRNSIYKDKSDLLLDLVMDKVSENNSIEIPSVSSKFGVAIRDLIRIKPIEEDKYLIQDMQAKVINTIFFDFYDTIQNSNTIYTYKNLNLSNIDFSNLDIYESNIPRLKFSHCDFSNSNLSNIPFNKIEFENCNLDNAVFSNIKFDSLSIIDSSVNNIDFSNSIGSIGYLDITNSDMSTCKALPLILTDLAGIWGTNFKIHEYLGNEDINTEQFYREAYRDIDNNVLEDWYTEDDMRFMVGYISTWTDDLDKKYAKILLDKGIDTNDVYNVLLNNSPTFADENIRSVDDFHKKVDNLKEVIKEFVNTKENNRDNDYNLNISPKKYDNINFTGVNDFDLLVSDTEFNNCKFNDTNIQNCTIDNCSFNGCDFSSDKMPEKCSDVKFDNCTFSTDKEKMAEFYSKIKNNYKNTYLINCSPSYSQLEKAAKAIKVDKNKSAGR